MPLLYAGIDIGGTKIAAALVGEDGRISSRRTAPTPRTGGADVLDTVAALVDSFDAPAAAIGVGSPGVVSPEGVVVSATDVLPGWAGTSVGPWLSHRSGLPVAVDNDVRAMARGEHAYGAGQGYADALYVSAGTGIGGALCRDGRIVSGPHGTAGELAHLLVPVCGPIACGCGRRDHLEAVASGLAIAASYAGQAGDLDLVQITDLMRNGDDLARSAIAAGGELLGRCLAGLAGSLDVSAVVIGGGVAQIGPDFLDPVARAFAAEVLPPLREVPVLAVRLGTDAPLVGAALLARDLAAAVRS